MFIIDGHNLLWGIRQLDEGHKGVSEVQLCRILSRYLKLTGERGEIVFDGAGPPDKSAFGDISGLEVLFAGLGTDTDAVIEGKIKASTAPRRLTIVSSDGRLRRAAKERKAISVKSEIFWKDVQKQLRRKRPQKEPHAKRQGLTESETDKWLEFFGFEQ